MRGIIAYVVTKWATIYSGRSSTYKHPELVRKPIVIFAYSWMVYFMIILIPYLVFL